jgi:tellurite resistance protein TehA-like permease
MGKFGLINSNIYRSYLHLIENKKWTYNYQYHMKVDWVTYPIPHKHIHLPGQSTDSPIDLVRKDRGDSDFKQQDRDAVRHCRVEFFAIPATLLILANMMRVANLPLFNRRTHELLESWHTRTLFWVLFWIGIGVFVAILALFSLRALFQSQKVIKEWFHPTMGNFFAAPVVAFILIGAMVLKTKPTAGITIIWIGSLVQMVFTIARLHEWVYSRVPEEFHKPSLLMTPVSLFLCAMAFAEYVNGGYAPHSSDPSSSINYLHVARMFFGVAAFFGLMLMMITFRFALLEHFSDDRTRFMIWIWLAAVAAFGQSYLAVSGNDPAVAEGVLYLSSYCVCCVLTILLTLGWFNGFFMMVKDLSIWVMAFALNVFAMFTMQYYQLFTDQASYLVVIIVYCMAVGATALCSLHTLSWFFDGSLFKPVSRFLSSFHSLNAYISSLFLYRHGRHSPLPRRRLSLSLLRDINGDRFSS